MAKNKNMKNIKDVDVEEIETEIEEFDDETFEVDIEDNNEEDFSFEELTMEERIIGIEKKVNTMFVLTIIIAIISLITLITNFNTVSSDTNTDTSTETSGGYSTEDFVKTTAHELESLSKNKSIVVWIGRQGCGYCTQYVPTITSVGKKLGTDDENSTIMEEFGATPMTLVIKNNKIIGSFTGALPEEDVLSTLKAEGFKEK